MAKGVRDYFEEMGYQVKYDDKTKNIIVRDPRTGSEATMLAPTFSVSGGKASAGQDVLDKVAGTIESGRYTTPSLGGTPTKQPESPYFMPLGTGIQATMAQYPTFNYPEYQPTQHKAMPFTEAYRQAKTMHDPNYQLQMLRANEAYSKDVKDLPYYLNVRGQAQGGLSKSMEEGLSQEHAKALAAAGFQHEALLNQAAQQMQDKSLEEARYREQMERADYESAYGRARGAFSDALGRLQYQTGLEDRDYERAYQAERDAISDAEREWQRGFKEREFDLTQKQIEENMKIARADLGIKQESARLSRALQERQLALAEASANAGMSDGDTAKLLGDVMKDSLSLYNAIKSNNPEMESFFSQRGINPREVSALKAAVEEDPLEAFDKVYNFVYDKYFGVFQHNLTSQLEEQGLLSGAPVQHRSGR